MPHRHSCRAQPRRIGNPLVPEDVTVGGDDQGGRQAGQVIGGERADQRPVPAIGPNVPLEHQPTGRDVQAGAGAGLPGLRAQSGVEERVDERLVPDGRRVPGARDEGERGGEVATGAVPGDGDAVRVDTGEAAVGQPAQRVGAVVESGRERVLGSEPIADRDHDVRRAGSDLGAQPVAPGETTKDEAATVQVEHSRALDGARRPVHAHAQRAAAAVDDLLGARHAGRPAPLRPPRRSELLSQRSRLGDHLRGVGEAEPPGEPVGGVERPHAHR